MNQDLCQLLDSVKATGVKASETFYKAKVKGGENFSHGHQAELLNSVQGTGLKVSEAYYNTLVNSIRFNDIQKVHNAKGNQNPRDNHSKSLHTEMDTYPKQHFFTEPSKEREDNWTNHNNTECYDPDSLDESPPLSRNNERVKIKTKKVPSTSGMRKQSADFKTTYKKFQEYMASISRECECFHKSREERHLSDLEKRHLNAFHCQQSSMAKKQPSHVTAVGIKENCGHLKISQDDQKCNPKSWENTEVMTSSSKINQKGQDVLEASNPVKDDSNKMYLTSYQSSYCEHLGGAILESKLQPLQSQSYIVQSDVSRSNECEPDSKLKPFQSNSYTVQQKGKDNFASFYQYDFCGCSGRDSKSQSKLLPSNVNTVEETVQQMSRPNVPISIGSSSKTARCNQTFIKSKELKNTTFDKNSSDEKLLKKLSDQYLGKRPCQNDVTGKLSSGNQYQNAFYCNGCFVKLANQTSSLPECPCKNKNTEIQPEPHYNKNTPHCHNCLGLCSSQTVPECPCKNKDREMKREHERYKDTSLCTDHIKQTHQPAECPCVIELERRKNENVTECPCKIGGIESKTDNELYRDNTLSREYVDEQSSKDPQDVSVAADMKSRSMQNFEEVNVHDDDEQNQAVEDGIEKAVSLPPQERVHGIYRYAQSQNVCQKASSFHSRGVLDASDMDKLPAGCYYYFCTPSPCKILTIQNKPQFNMIDSDHPCYDCLDKTFPNTTQPNKPVSTSHLNVTLTENPGISQTEVNKTPSSNKLTKKINSNNPSGTKIMTKVSSTKSLNKGSSTSVLKRFNFGKASPNKSSSDLKKTTSKHRPKKATSKVMSNKGSEAHVSEGNNCADKQTENFCTEERNYCLKEMCACHMLPSNKCNSSSSMTDDRSPSSESKILKSGSYITSQTDVQTPKKKRVSIASQKTKAVNQIPSQEKNTLLNSKVNESKTKMANVKFRGKKSLEEHFVETVSDSTGVVEALHNIHQHYNNTQSGDVYQNAQPIISGGNEGFSGNVLNTEQQQSNVIKEKRAVGNGSKLNKNAADKSKDNRFNLNKTTASKTRATSASNLKGKCPSMKKGKSNELVASQKDSLFDANEELQPWHTEMHDESSDNMTSMKDRTIKEPHTPSQLERDNSYLALYLKKSKSSNLTNDRHKAPDYTNKKVFQGKDKTNMQKDRKEGKNLQSKIPVPLKRRESVSQSKELNRKASTDKESKSYKQESIPSLQKPIETGEINSKLENQPHIAVTNDVRLSQNQDIKSSANQRSQKGGAFTKPTDSDFSKFKHAIDRVSYLPQSPDSNHSSNWHKENSSLPDIDISETLFDSKSCRLSAPIKVKFNSPRHKTVTCDATPCIKLFKGSLIHDHSSNEDSSNHTYNIYRRSDSNLNHINDEWVTSENEGTILSQSSDFCQSQCSDYTDKTHLSQSHNNGYESVYDEMNNPRFASTTHHYSDLYSSFDEDQDVHDREQYVMASQANERGSMDEYTYGKEQSANYFKTDYCIGAEKYSNNEGVLKDDNKVSCSYYPPRKSWVLQLLRDRISL